MISDETKKCDDELAAAKRKIKKLEKQNAEFQQTIDELKKRRKLEVYALRFLNLITELDKQEKLLKDSSGEYECINAVDFRNQLNIMQVDVNESLRVFRELGWIITDANAYTTTRRVNGKVKRVIAFKTAMDNLLRDLWERV